MTHTVSIQSVQPRAIAAVRARLPVRRVSAMFSEYLNQVYAARSSGLKLDGQNVFVYHGTLTDTESDVDFGVGVAAPFTPIGAVQYTMVPSGDVAHTRHHGDYGGLGEAHAAVIAWCAAQGRALAGPRWEVYGHQGPDAPPAPTDIYYLLAGGVRP